MGIEGTRENFRGSISDERWGQGIARESCKEGATEKSYKVSRELRTVDRPHGRGEQRSL